jgi:hypothetical protein
VLRFLLAGIAMGGGALSVMTEGPWTIGGAIAAIIAAVVVICTSLYEFVLRQGGGAESSRFRAKRGF